jgi:hypothetical protein
MNQNENIQTLQNENIQTLQEMTHSVGSRSSIGHTETIGSIMLEIRDKLILKVTTPNRFTTYE